MPLASKKNVRTEKANPAQIDVEPEPKSLQDEVPIQPKVTALIVSHNNADGLRRLLAGLEASRDRALIEILVVDKGSRDESPQLDAEFPNTTFLRLPRNFGTTKAMNIAMRTGVGDFVFFLRPEIEVMPDTIPLLVAALEADEQAVAVCPVIREEDGQLAQQFFRLPTPQTGAEPVPVALGEQTEVECASLEALLARKYFIKGINYFDERFGEYGADEELCFQIRRAGRKIKVLPEVEVKRHAIPERISSAAATLLTADRIHGTAVYFSKHFGFVSGVTFRIGQGLKALVRFRLPLVWEVLSGTKVDGSQGIEL